MFLIFCCVLVAWSTYYAEAACPTIISKKEWDAKNPDHVKYLATPVDLVIIQHTVTQSCNDDLSCAEVIRELQKIHLEKAALWDIGPSFLVGGNGKVYEGRGWRHVGIHTIGYNNQSIAIAFVGNFNNQEPSPKALEAARALIQCGVEDVEVLTSDHQVVVQAQLIPTESPGKKLADKIMSWPDWMKDVTDIKKRADKEEQKKDYLQGKSSTGLILTDPKQIDFLSNLRDVIAELIDNMSKLAHQTLDTTESFTRGMKKQAGLFIEGVASTIKKLRDQVSAVFSSVSAIPGAKKCADPLREKANALHDNTEAKSKACADERVKQLDDMIKHLSTLSSNAIDYTGLAVQNSKNCTELNVGLQAPTKYCLNNVKEQTETATKTFQSQRSLALESIETSLKALPAALELCSKQHLLEAGTETAKIVSSISSCSTKGLGFGF